jgi:two-component system, NtrC family, sensor kinase
VKFDLPFRSRSLKVRLILSYLVILGAGGLITSLVGSWIVSTTIMAEAQRTAEHDLVTARTLYQGELDALRQSVTLTTPAITAEDARAPSPGVLARLGAAAAEAECDFFTLADARGQVTARVAQPRTIGDDVSTIQVVQAALRGDPAAATEILTADQLAREAPRLQEQAAIRVVPTARARPSARPTLTDGLVLVAAAPVRDQAGRVVGVLYAGRLLNRRFELVDRVWTLLYRGERYRREDVGTVTVFQREVRIATTVRAADGTRAIGSQVSAPVHDAVLVRGLPWRGRAFVVNDWYIAAYDPIQDLRGSVVGILYVGVLERAYASIRDRVVFSFFGIATLGFLLIIGITYAIISNITSPIGEMVAATRNITAGRLDEGVRVAAPGELRLLAESFNTMLASLRQMRSDLEEWGRTLEEKVRERTDQVTAMQTRVAQAERLASLGMLAAGVAHEVNNPLGGILALTALTLEDLPPDHPDRHNLEVVLRQTERCRDIVKGLLDFSRQSEVTMQQLDLNAVLQDTLALIAQQSSFFNVRIERHLSDELPAVVGDRSQLQQVLLNILVNAVQAMEERGTIAITTRVVRERRDVEIRIADTGCGIPRDAIDKIFDPFFTTREGGRGTGLGLAIAYGIVTQHRGHIGVESTVGRGTTFTIRLPAASPPTLPTASPRAEAFAGPRAEAH